MLKFWRTKNKGDAAKPKSGGTVRRTVMSLDLFVRCPICHQVTGERRGLEIVNPKSCECDVKTNQ